jgi:hypothetical protein
MRIQNTAHMKIARKEIMIAILKITTYFSNILLVLLDLPDDLLHLLLPLVLGLKPTLYQ